MKQQCFGDRLLPAGGQRLVRSQTKTPFEGVWRISEEILPGANAVPRPLTLSRA